MPASIRKDPNAVARTGHPWRWRVGIGVVVVAALVGIAVSVQQLLDLQARKEVAESTTTGARFQEARLDAAAADLEAVIEELDAEAADHLSRAASIDETVATITEIRTAIETLKDRLIAAQGEREVRQGRIDQLLRCRDTLDAAIDQLQGDLASPEGALLVMDQGRAGCQSAMELAQGDTGAVHPYDFPDPSILLVGDTYYAYSTEGPGGPIQTLSSKDLRNWTVRATALANRPAWAKPESTWAPTVHPFGDRFILYYATRSKVSSQQCISSAVGLHPAGPFLDDSPVPLVCQDDRGGSIDPDVYVDELGFAHITWKSEDETRGGVSHLWTQNLGADGRSVNGFPKELLRSDQAWQDDVIENPSMVHLDGTWILLYAGNRWNTSGYSVAYAVCETSTGPCYAPERPRVRISGSVFEGPGGADAFRTRGGRMAVAYAAWDRGRVGYPNPRRLHLSTITYRDGALWWQEL